MREIPVFYITNRLHRLDKGLLSFSAQLQDPISASYRAGHARLRHHGTELQTTLCELYPERQMHTDPVADAMLARADLPPELRLRAARQVALERAGARIQRGSSEMMLAMQEEMAGSSRDALLFIHGFACDFDASLARLGQLLHAYHDSQRAPLVGCVFAWPAEGRSLPPLEYFHDRQAAELSGRALARALCRLVEFMRLRQSEGQPCWRKIHLLVHGMGAWVLRHALQALCNDYLPGRCPPLFEHVFLMAPDEDDDALEHNAKLACLGNLSRAIHVYYSRHDLALERATEWHSHPPSLGQHGPRRMQGLSDRVVAVDCQRVSQTEAGHGHHQYYWARPEVVQDVLAVLAGHSADKICGREHIGQESRRFRLVPAALAGAA